MMTLEVTVESIAREDSPYIGDQPVCTCMPQLLTAVMWVVECVLLSFWDLGSLSYQSYNLTLGTGFCYSRELDLDIYLLSAFCNNQTYIVL